MADDARITQIAHRLHGLPLAAFIRERDAEVAALKKAGEGGLSGRVKALRKPAAGAHLVNLLVRGDPDLMGEVRDLGERLRSAQSAADATGLRTLDRERRTLVTRSVAAARTLADDAGVGATEASLRDVEQSVWAALVDPAAQAAVQAGMLVRPLSPNGFGDVDLDGASAVPVDVAAVQQPRRRRGRRRPTPSAPAPDTSEASAQVEVAAAELAGAERALAEATRSVSDTDVRLDALQDELAELRERTAAVEDAIRDGRAERSDRRAAVRSAEKARRTAATKAERARRRLDDLQDGSSD